jgi:hypothetical protein
VAEAVTPGNGRLGAGASATAFYNFQVVGPTDGVPTDLLIDFHLTATSTPDSAALARMILRAGTFAVAFEACSDFEVDPNCGEPDRRETVSFTALSGSVTNSVTLYAQAQAAVTRLTHETAQALADPYIRVDPSFPDAHLYSVLVSPGFGNAPPVPEPPAPWLLGAGLLWLGWGNRIRQGTRSA